MLEVYKFGGTCTASSAKLQRVTEIVCDAPKPLIVTLSAAAGVTDLIKNVLHHPLNDERIGEVVMQLESRHRELLPENTKFPKLVTESLERFERLLYGIFYTEELTDRTQDLVMTFGERLIVPIFGLYLESINLKTSIVQAEDLITTNGASNNSLVLLGDTKLKGQKILEDALASSDVVIVPGYYGESQQGVITTLGRSGTDYTATTLAYIVGADSVTIWKDVHGFMSADPSKVDAAHTIPYLSYAEAAELAYFGAKLLHPRAASPARIRNIPIYIRHIEDLQAVTCINGDGSKSKTVIKSVSHLENLALVKVYASIGGNTKGVMAKISEKIAEAGGNTISVATSQTCIAFLMSELQAEDSASAIEDLGPNLVDSVDIIDKMSLICVVGEGLSHTPGIASKVFDAIAKLDVNVDLISAGASETAYHFTVREDDLNTALNAVHDQFFGEQ